MKIYVNGFFVQINLFTSDDSLAINITLFSLSRNYNNKACWGLLLSIFYQQGHARFSHLLDLELWIFSLLCLFGLACQYMCGLRFCVKFDLFVF